MLKNILIGAGVVFGLIFLAMISMVMIVSSVNKPKGNKEEVLAGNGRSKKALIVYQPALTGITSRVARQIAKGLNEGGYEVTLNHPGEHLPADLSQYPIIVFGSPVYATQLSKALTDYMSKVQEYPSRRIVLYSTGSVMNEVKELDAMESLLKGGKAFKKVKFSAAGNNDNDKLAYELGKELAGE
jgi:flavorubredoxin